jgi:WD40 repeat protein
MSLSLQPLPFLLFGSLLALPLAAADPPAPAEPTAKEVQALREKYDAERAAALKAKFPPDAVAKSDLLLKRAEEALKAENFRSAARYVRDARWQLPYVPPGLPQHVARVLGESRMRHADRVNAVAYAPDGLTVASASKDGTVKVWDLGNGREVCTYRGHLDQPNDSTKGTNVLGVADVAFHPKGKVAASAAGNQVHLWDPATGKSVKTVLNLGKTDKPVKAVAYSPDGKRLAVGADDGVLRVIDSESGKEVYASPSRNARIERVCYSPNGKLVALGDSAGQVAVYVPEGRMGGNPLAMSVQGADIPEITGVAFSGDGAAVFSSGRDGKVRLTAGPTPDGGSAPNTATKLRDFVGHTGPITGLAVTPDGAQLVTGGEDRTVRVWDTKTGKQLRSFQGHATKVTAVAVRSDGRQVASAAEDGAVRVWDLNASDEHRAMTDAKESLWAVAVSPDGKRLAAAGADRKIRVYDPDTGKLQATLDAGAAMTSLAFFPDNTRLAAGGGDNKVKVWDVAEKKVVQEMTGFGLAVLAVALGDNGKLVVAGSADSTVRGFDPAGGKELWKWSARKAACGVAVRKGGKQVAVGLADGGLVILDVSGSAPKEVAQQSAHTAGVACVAYSPDGERLATVGGDGAIRVWTVAENGTPTPLVRFEGPPATGPTGFSPLSTVAFSPDGRFVAAAGADGAVRVWDVQTKSEIRDLRGSTDWVTSVAFSPDGRFLASVSAEKDNTVRVFELPSLENAGAGSGHLRGINAVAVSPDGKLIATASTDETIKLWDAESGKEVGTLVGDRDTPWAVAFLGKGMLVMGGLSNNSTGRLHYWTTSPPRLLKTVPTGEVYTIVPSGDGSRIAVWAARPSIDGMSKNSTYELYTAQGNAVGQPYADKGRDVRSATFSPDLSWAVTGDNTGGVQIFDLAKRERVGGNMPLFERDVVDIGVTADKKYIVATDDEGLVKVGELKGGKLDVVAKGKAHKDGVRALYVSPGGKSFLTVGNDRELKLWSLTDLKPESLTELRSWTLPVIVKGAAFAPDGKFAVTANADGTAFVLELP